MMICLKPPGYPTQLAWLGRQGAASAAAFALALDGQQARCILGARFQGVTFSQATLTILRGDIFSGQISVF